MTAEMTMSEERRRMIRQVRLMAVLGFIVTLMAAGCIIYLIVVGRVSIGLVSLPILLLGTCGLYVWHYWFLTRRLRNG